MNVGGVIILGNISCNFTHHFVATQVAEKIALCNVPHNKYFWHFFAVAAIVGTSTCTL